MNILKSLLFRFFYIILQNYFKNLKYRQETSKKKILISCSHFWPSIGGIESQVEQLGSRLVQCGYSVFICTRDIKNRNCDQRYGINIISVDNGRLFWKEWPWLFKTRYLLQNGEFDVCILIQDPTGNLIWSIEGVTPPIGTKLIIQPIINQDGYSRLKRDRRRAFRLAMILRSATTVLSLTRSGADIRYMLSCNISPVYLPNAVSVAKPSGNFRITHNIPEDDFVILHVANLYWVKNHLNLLDALNTLPAKWHLVLIGNPSGEHDCALAVADKLKNRPDVLFLSGLDSSAVSSAMSEADVIVLASKGEGAPLTILEAMAHGKPWLATPECGGANDNAGGIICDLPQFIENLKTLHREPILRQKLGKAGFLHWHECFSWEKVLPGWIDVVETGKLQRTYSMPLQIALEMKKILRSFFHDQYIEDTKSISSYCHENKSAFVNIGLITFNRLEFTRQAIEALCQIDSGFEFALTVVDNGSNDGTQAYLKQLKGNSIIKNLVLLDDNVGVAKASNLAWSLEPVAEYYLKLDNDIVMRRSGWLRDMVEVSDNLLEAGVIGYNFEPRSYPALKLHGVTVRPKIGGNLGGACILIPKRTRDLLGYWCEDYGKYGEEDFDYCMRVECAGLFNVYMENEDIGLHLPAGKAAKIGYFSKAIDGLEECIHSEYRSWKDKSRRELIKSGLVAKKVDMYRTDRHSLYHASSFAEKWLNRNG